MRANQFIPEAAIGTHPKRPSREGSRPERGHEPQKRYVTDRKTGKQYDPDEEFDKLKNSPEFQSQMKRMAQKEGFDYTMKDLGNDYAGFASNHSMKHKMLKRINPEKHQLYKDKMNNMHEFDDLLKLFKVAQARGDVIEQSVAEGNPWANVIHSTDIHAEKAQRELKNKQAVADSAKVLKNHAKALEPKEIELIKKYNLFHRGRMPEGSYSRLDDEKAEKLIQNVLRFNEQGVAEGSLEESIDTILADLEEGGGQGPTSKKVCLSSVSDDALGVSQLASCKSQGLRARDGKKSHLIGHGNSKVRVTVGGKKIKGKKHGGPLPDYGTRKGQ